MPADPRARLACAYLQQPGLPATMSAARAWRSFFVASSVAEAARSSRALRLFDFTEAWCEAEKRRRARQMRASCSESSATKPVRCPTMRSALPTLPVVESWMNAAPALAKMIVTITAATKAPRAAQRVHLAERQKTSEAEAGGVQAMIKVRMRKPTPLATLHWVGSGPRHDIAPLPLPLPEGFPVSTGCRLHPPSTGWITASAKLSLTTVRPGPA